MNDAHALYVYTLDTEIYACTNRCIQQPDVEALDPMRPFAHQVQKALAKLPAHDWSHLYKGIGCRVSGYEEGAVVRWEAFSSTTSDVNVVRRVVGSEGSMFVVRPMRGSKGRSIRCFSAFSDEAEVLFDAHSLFRVRRRLSPRSRSALGHHLGWDLQTTDVYELEEVDEATARHASDHRHRVVGKAQATHQLRQHVQAKNARECLEAIRAGADVNVTAKEGTSLLMAAALGGMEQVLLCTGLPGMRPRHTHGTRHMGRVRYGVNGTQHQLQRQRKADHQKNASSSIETE